MKGWLPLVLAAKRVLGVRVEWAAGCRAPMATVTV